MISLFMHRHKITTTQAAEAESRHDVTHWFVDYCFEALSLAFWLLPSWFLGLGLAIIDHIATKDCVMPSRQIEAAVSNKDKPFL